jgi:hypothetical protein
VQNCTVWYLYHKALDDSVEYHIVVVPVASQSLQKRDQEKSREEGREEEETGEVRQQERKGN